MNNLFESIILEPHCEGMFHSFNYAIELNFDLMKANVFEPNNFDARHVWLHEYAHYAQFVSTLFGFQLYLLITLQQIYAYEFISRFLIMRKRGQKLRLPLMSEQNRFLSTAIEKAFDLTMVPAMEIERYLNVLLYKSVLEESPADFSSTLKRVNEILQSVFGRDKWALPVRFEIASLVNELPQRAKHLLNTQNILESWAHLVACVRMQAVSQHPYAYWLNKSVGGAYAVFDNFIPLKLRHVPIEYWADVVCAIAEFAVIGRMGCIIADTDATADDFGLNHPVSRLVTAFMRVNNGRWPSKPNGWEQFLCFVELFSDRNNCFSSQQINDFVGSACDRLFEMASDITRSAILQSEILYMGQVFEKILSLRSQIPELLVNISCARDFQPFTQRIGSPLVFCPGHWMPLVPTPSFPLLRDDQDALIPAWINKQVLLALLRYELCKIQNKSFYFPIGKWETESAELKQMSMNGIFQANWNIKKWQDLFH